MPKMIMRTNHHDPYFATKERKEAKTNLSKSKFKVGEIVEGNDAIVLSKLGVAVDEKDFKVLIARKKLSDPNNQNTVSGKATKETE